jgi:endonuclease YncB( thermonuclease family)
VDGDTIQVRLDSGPITIRLHGIDAPEARQSLGRAATKALRGRVEGEPLEIEPVEQNDGYGRMVATVRVRGDDVNARMVESGFAWAYRRYLRHQLADEHYCQLEADARAARRGLWAGPPEQWRPPWELRAGSRGEAPPRVNYAGETADRPEEPGCDRWFVSWRCLARRRLPHQGQHQRSGRADLSRPRRTLLCRHPDRP